MTPADPATTEPPLADALWGETRFWILQIGILALTLGRLAAALLFHVSLTSLAFAATWFVLFILPALYAGLAFGVNGAAATTAWITVLGTGTLAATWTHVPRSVLILQVLQLLVLGAVALLAGRQMTTERHARHRAELQHAQDLRAEALYRDLFESNRSPILIVDAEGRICEANAAAFSVFGPGIDQGRRLIDVLGPRAASQLLATLVAGTTPNPMGRDLSYDLISMLWKDEQLVLRPSATMLDRLQRSRRMQIVLEDVTSEVRNRDQMEAYASQVVRGQEEERRHIAQELHDGPLQTLVLLCRQIDTLAGEGRSGGMPVLAGAPTALAPTATAEALTLRHTVEEAVQELRSIAKGLRPSILDDLGLVAGINQLVVELEKRGRVRASFGVAGEERRLASALELTLFRIAQEAMSNVDKHSGATTVAVGLNFDDTGVRLLIKDDGKGIPQGLATGTTSTESLGLPGMRQRASLVGGRLVVHSAPRQGSTIDAWVPAPAV